MTAAYATSAAAAVAAGTANVVPNKPASVAVGDLLVASCWANNTNSTWAAPAGWTLVPGAVNVGAGGNMFYRVADGSEGATFTFTRTGTTGTAGVAVVRCTTAGLPQSGACNGTAASATIALASVTAGWGSLLLQFAHSVNTTADSWSPPGTATERVDTTASGSAIEYAIGDEVVGAGATGTRTWTHTNGTSTRGAQVAIAPAPTAAFLSLI